MAMGWITSAVDSAAAKLIGRVDPAPAFKFYVEIMGVIVAEFLECSGLGMEREVVRHREGGTNDFEWLLPGQIRYDNIRLRRGITFSPELWRWFRHGILDGQVYGLSTIPKAAGSYYLQRFPMGTNMAIILGTIDGWTAKHWDVIGAMPVKWTGPQLNTGSSEVAVEELEIAHHGLDLSATSAAPMKWSV